MNDSICPSCGKPNPNTVEICQYCGTILKRSATEPLAPLHPGDMPSKINTSDLERTLPGWLRDVRKASSAESNAQAVNQSGASEPRTPAAPPSAKPAPPRQQDSTSPLDFLAGLSQANDEEEEETPDWLKSLQNSMPAPLEPVPTPKPAEQQPADWLSTLQSEVQKDEPPLIESEQNWGFGNQPATFNFDETAETANLDTGDTPDWLAALKAQDEPAATPIPRDAPPAAPITGEQTSRDNLPDWISALSGADTAPSTYESQPAQPPATSDDTPDWLSALSGAGTAPSTYESQPAQQPPAASDDTPDWLSALSGTGTAPSAYESQPTQQPPAASDDTPDWLSSLGGGFNIEEAPVSQEINSQFTADTPDWLANLGGDSLTPGKKESAGPAPSESLPAADLPSWMADLSSDLQPAKPQIEKPTFGAVPTQPESQPADSDIPAWMAGLQGLSVEKPVPQEPSSGEVLPNADVPDWMADLKEEPIPGAQPDFAESTPPVGSDMPSWLAEAMGEKPADKPAEPARPRKPFDTGSLRELGPLDDAGELPDWITRLGESPETPKPVETPEIVSTEKTWGAPEAPIRFETTIASEAAGFEASAKAEAEANVAPVSQSEPASFETAPAETEAAASLPLFSDEQNLDAILSLDMPDWLSGFTPTEAELKDAEVVEQPADANNIRPADLPSWVQAMRPVEDVMSEAIGEDEDQQMERSGPLAGLRSVLPTLPSLPAPHKPKSYSIKLRVDETQRAQAALLENLLNSENTPRTVSRRAETTIIRPLRWIIAGVLLVTVLLASLASGPLGMQMFPSPVMSTGTSDLGSFKTNIDKIIDDASAGAPVLVVVDYQPGFAGEMEPAAGAVIRQLTSHNAPLAFISTSPMGPYLAERLLQKFTDAGQPYLPGTQYVNLGYLPGGAGGIQVFAELPGTTVGQDSIWGILVNLWDQDALKNATKENGTKLSNFAAVIVLTDNPDTGRLWIEQAEPSLRPKPMLMVVSAQAEPMIRPYVISGQLQGLIAGLEGGARYENALGKPAEAHFYWDAFGVGMIVAELLILIGGAWSLVTNIRTRRVAKEQDEA